MTDFLPFVSGAQSSQLGSTYPAPEVGLGQTRELRTGLGFDFCGEHLFLGDKRGKGVV